MCQTESGETKTALYALGQNERSATSQGAVSPQLVVAAILR